MSTEELKGSFIGRKLNLGDFSRGEGADRVLILAKQDAIICTLRSSKFLRSALILNAQYTIPNYKRIVKV